MTRAQARAARDPWSIFEGCLASVLASLENDQFLILEVPGSARYLQFACRGPWGLQAEVSSNRNLPPEDRLAPAQQAWLRRHGWQAPTARGNREQGASPNYHGTWQEGGAAVLAQDAVLALREALQVPHPRQLTYRAFPYLGPALELPDLGLRRSVDPEVPLIERVLAVFRDVTGLPDLSVDSDGDVSAVHGSVLVVARPAEGVIRLLAVLATEVPVTPALQARLHRANDGPQGIRIVLREDTVYAAYDVPADPFVPVQLEQALRRFAPAVDAESVVLRAELAGNGLPCLPGVQVALQ